MRFDVPASISTAIAAGTLLVSASLAYAALDKRVTVIEQTIPEHLLRVETELKEVKEELKRLSAAVNRQDRN